MGFARRSLFLLGGMRFNRRPQRRLLRQASCRFFRVVIRRRMGDRAKRNFHDARRQSPNRLLGRLFAILVVLF